VEEIGRQVEEEERDIRKKRRGEGK